VETVGGGTGVPIMDGDEVGANKFHCCFRSENKCYVLLNNESVSVSKLTQILNESSKIEATCEKKI
jgi:hypothetical protein